MSMYNDYNRYDFCPTDPGYPDGHHHEHHCNPCATLTPIRRVNTRFIASGSIIPFSSGTVPPVLVTVLSTAIAASSFIGFGTSIPAAITIVGNTLPLLPATLSEAFTVPRDGVITSLAANFSTTAAVTLTAPATITAQLFSAPIGTNTFTAVPGALVQLTPAITGIVTIGTNASGIVTLSEPVTAQTRLLMVFYATSTAVGTGITGNASAGVAIR